MNQPRSAIYSKTTTRVSRSTRPTNAKGGHWATHGPIGILPSYLSTTFDLAVPMVASVLLGSVSGRALGDINSSGADGRAASNGRPEQLPSFSAETAPMEMNPRALSCRLAMVGPLLALGRSGLGLVVRIWQPDVSGRRDGLPVYVQFLLLRSACEMRSTKRQRLEVWPSVVDFMSP